MRTVTATRYVTPLREGGSLPGLMEADDQGLYVVKFRGAGQGTLALVAEVIAGELARAMGFPVPEIVLVNVSAELAAAEADPEIQDLIKASDGVNLGMDFLPGAFPFAPPIKATFAADVVWFDALIGNVDRTAKNPNLLNWHARTWLIDHGAALIAQHSSAALVDSALNPFPAISKHVLISFANSILDAHARMSSHVTPDLLENIVNMPPKDWFKNHAPEDYATYLLKRVADKGFAAEAENAR
ncbi:MAG: aminotransferase class I and II [Spirochaetia bacterium]|nr:aminotransferase class I and II [Spirochaetia bacterium]